MAHVALFHSALGVRPGVLDAAECLHGVGHEVLVVGQYDGRVFDDHDEASSFVEEAGFPELTLGFCEEPIGARAPIT